MRPGTQKFYSKPCATSASVTGRRSPSGGLPRFGGWNRLPREAAQSAQMPLGTRSSPAEGETSMNATPVVSPLLLRNVPLFSLLSEGQLQLLTRVLSRKSFPKNSAVIAAGEPTDALYIVISGRLKVIMSDNEGREVILANLNQGEFFGEMGLIDQAPRSATDHNGTLRTAHNHPNGFHQVPAGEF